MNILYWFYSANQNVVFYENQPLTKEDVHKIYQSKRIFFVYNVEIAMLYSALYAKLNMLIDNKP